MVDTLDVAKAYLARGYSVLPIQHRDKRPALPSWDKFKTERPSEQELSAWFKGNNRNIGIVTGAVSGIVVLDVDAADKEGDPDGADSLAKMVERFGALPETAISSTGKGKHIVFKHPGFEVRNFSKKKRTGLDFRGDGGYIVAAPSIHPNGNAYEWVCEAEPADMPEWLIELLKDGPEPAWFTEMFPPPMKAEMKRSNAPKGEFRGGAGAAEVILNNCAFCQYARDEAATLSEPEWYAMLTNIGRAEGGAELVHELSKPHPKYNMGETDYKLQHALEDGEPHTCAHIMNNFGFTGCPDGGCGVKAPIGFATDSLVVAKVAVDSVVRKLREAESERKRDLVFEDEVIGALATLRQRDAAEYSKVKGAIKDAAGKGNVNLNDLERAVKQRQDKNKEQRLRIVRSSEVEETIITTVDWMINAPMEQAVRPKGYTITEDGITTVDWNGEEIQEVQVFPAPVLISQRFKSLDDGSEKVELSYRWDGEWQRLTVDADVPFTSSKVSVLRKDGFPVSSESAKPLVKFLDAFTAANKDHIPIRQSVGHMGWVGSKHFLPGAQGDIHLDVAEGGTAGIAAGYREHGELEKWVEFVTPLRQYPIARFTMAAAFAAPLMALVSQRVFIVHNWGPSRGGKTASLLAALSVWGDPHTIVASFNATKVGLERMAGFYSDLPLGIDERQVVGDKQGFVESLVYMLGLGKGKARGSKGGGLQAFQNWRTIALTTGEEPLSNDSSTQGIKTRALEINGVPIEDENLARQVHQGIASHYGVAGPAFVKQVMDELAADSDYFKSDYEALMQEWESRQLDALGSHISAITTVMMADYYASQWIFGLDEDTAYAEAWTLGETILSKLDTGKGTEDAVRAMEHLGSWFNVNRTHFESEPEKAGNQWYGFRNSEGVAFFPTVFDKAMQDGKFNPRRILNDWADRDWIETEVYPGEGKRRFKVQKMVNYQKHRVVFVKHDMLCEADSG